MSNTNQFTEEQYDSKDIYLRKDGAIIGLHSIGMDNQEWDLILLDGTRVRQYGFQAIESWGNEYDENRNILGRGSFRVFESIENLAKEFEQDGWERYEGPKRKEEG